MSFAQAFPGSPNRMFGFFLNYTYDSDNNTISFPNTPVMPGGSLGGFSFTGSPESTWDVFGPNKTDADAPFTPSEMESATGTSTVTPEPAVMGVVAAGMVMGRRRRRVSGLRELNRQDAKTPRRSA